MQIDVELAISDPMLRAGCRLRNGLRRMHSLIQHVQHFPIPERRCFHCRHEQFVAHFTPEEQRLQERYVQLAVGD